MFFYNRNLSSFLSLAKKQRPKKNVGNEHLYSCAEILHDLWFLYHWENDLCFKNNLAAPQQSLALPLTQQLTYDQVAKYKGIGCISNY